MPVLGLGTWKAGEGTTKSAVKTALEKGYVHIDAAKVYGNQAEVGQAIDQALQSGGLQREQLWVTSKLWCADIKPEFVRGACEETLRELHLNYLDQYLIHWPCAFERSDPYEMEPKGADGNIKTLQVDFADVWREMEKLVDAKLVRSIGISNFNEEETQHILDNARIKPDVNQLEVHPYFQNQRLLQWLDGKGVKVVAYSPFGRVGSCDAAGSPQDDDVIKNVAKAHNKSPAQVIIRWHLQNGRVAIPKSSNAGRIAENTEVFDFELTDKEMADIKALDRNQRGNNPPYRANGQLAFPN